MFAPVEKGQRGSVLVPMSHPPGVQGVVSKPWDGP